MRGESGQVVDALGGARVLKGRVRTPEELQRRIRQGLPYGALAAVGAAFALSSFKLSEVLDIPKRTLERRRIENRLKPDESDRLVRFARVAAMAEDRIGTREQAARWLQEPNDALGGGVPVDFLDNDVGTRQVEDLLERIAYGVVS